MTYCGGHRKPDPRSSPAVLLTTRANLSKFLVCLFLQPEDEAKEGQPFMTQIRNTAEPCGMVNAPQMVAIRGGLQPQWRGVKRWELKDPPRNTTLPYSFLSPTGMTGLQPGPPKESCTGTESSFLAPIWKQSIQMTGGEMNTAKGKQMICSKRTQIIFIHKDYIQNFGFSQNQQEWGCLGSSVG